MGLLLFPVFERPLKLPTLQTSGEFLGSSWDVLDEVASLHQLTPLSSLGDTRSLPDDFQGDPADIEDVLGPCNIWHDSAAGVAAIQALSKLIESRSDISRKLQNPEDVLRELKELHSQVEVAANQGVRFRLELQ